MRRGAPGFLRVAGHQPYHTLIPCLLSDVTVACPIPLPRRQAQQAAQLAALVQQQAIAGYGMAPMAAYGMGYPHVAAVTSPPVAPPKQVARRVNLDHARVDQTDSEQDSDVQ